MDNQSGAESASALLEIIRRFSLKGVEGECCGDLPIPEYFALASITDAADCSIQDIGERLGFTKSGATKLVNRLEWKGYAKRTPSAADRRFCYVEITEKGKEMLEQTVARYSAELTALLGRLPAESREETERALRALAAVSSK